jgi:hypothetical protein
MSCRAALIPADKGGPLPLGPAGDHRIDLLAGEVVIDQQRLGQPLDGEPVWRHQHLDPIGQPAEQLELLRCRVCAAAGPSERPLAVRAGGGCGSAAMGRRPGRRTGPPRFGLSRRKT